MRAALLSLIGAGLLFGQATGESGKDMPPLLTFVAPPYPQAARTARIMGKTRTGITVNREGAVTEVKTIVAHPVFREQVLAALKQWRFGPSDQDHALEITCLFELVEDEKCDGRQWETYVSAELPTVVHVKTSFCNEVQRSSNSR